MVLEGTDDDHARSRRRPHPGHRAPGRAGQPRDRRPPRQLLPRPPASPSRRRADAHDARRHRALRGRQDRSGEAGAHGRAHAHRRSHAHAGDLLPVLPRGRRAAALCRARAAGRASRRGRHWTREATSPRADLAGPARASFRSIRIWNTWRAGLDAVAMGELGGRDPRAVHAGPVRAVEVDRVEATARELDPQVALRHLGVVERGIDPGPAPHQPVRALHDVLLPSAAPGDHDQARGVALESSSPADRDPRCMARVLRGAPPARAAALLPIRRALAPPKRDACRSECGRHGVRG